MIISRELGEQIPISIGTAIAVEAVLNAESYSVDGSEPPETLYVNVRTLLRNLTGAVPEGHNASPDDIVSDLAEEMLIIRMALANNSIGSPIATVFYCNHYNGLSKMFPEANLKQPRTQKQKEYRAFEEDVINLLPNLILGGESDDIVENILYGDVGVAGQDERAMVLTHYPVDLLSRYQFNQLTLVESHTGTFKGQSRWNSKISGGSQNSRIPFNYFTIQVFGDNANHFLGWPITFKRKVLELAKLREWNAVTTIEKIKIDLYLLAAVDRPIHDRLNKLLATKPPL